MTNMTMKTALIAALFVSVAGASAAFAVDDAVKPAPTPPPAAGPTKAAAEAFCGDTAGKAVDLFARYSTASNLKQTYTSDLYVAFADDEKNPAVVYTFTTKRQPAHPAAVCRKLVKEGDKAVLKMVVVCDGDEAQCAILRNDFNLMNARMQVEVDQKMAAGKK